VDVPPESLGQMELYVEREMDISHAAKILYRANSTGNDVVKLRSKHEIWTSVLDSVAYPCGELVHQANCENDGYCLYQFNQTQFPQEMHLKAPFLYHYVTRSSQECRLKLDYLPADNWRVLNAATVCAERIEGRKMVNDYGVYCSGRTVRNLLYSSYK
jgi:hypothetical protein